MKSSTWTRIALRLNCHCRLTSSPPNSPRSRIISLVHVMRGSFGGGCGRPQAGSNDPVNSTTVPVAAPAPSCDSGAAPGDVAAPW